MSGPWMEARVASVVRLSSDGSKELLEHAERWLANNPAPRFRRGIEDQHSRDGRRVCELALARLRYRSWFACQAASSSRNSVA